ncbi:MAG: hypothetical protein IJC07_00410 [Clostridia bacterium]|nr:hypothetical protein [Clostridia bacterium]
MKKRKKLKTLSKPSVFRRVWKVWLYNIFWSVLFFGWFLSCYTIDDVAWHLDQLTMNIFTGFTLDLVLCCTSFWFFFRQIFKDLNLIKFTYLMTKHDKEILTYGNKVVFEGPEGLGKTLNTANTALFLAVEKDREMRLRYYLDYPFRNGLGNNKDFKVLEDSFNYYEENAVFNEEKQANIPHLMANFKIEYQGRRSYPFDLKILDQEVRPPEGLSVALTEVGNVLPNSESRISKKDTSDFKAKVKQETLSLTRQWFLMNIIADEQRTGEIFLGFRSVVSNNYRLIERKNILEPHFLIKVKNMVGNIVLWRKKKNKRFRTKIFNFLTDLILDIGFYRFVYESKDAQTSSLKEENLTFIISKDLPFKFDTRGEREKYSLYEKKVS